MSSPEQKNLEEAAGRLVDEQEYMTIDAPDEEEELDGGDEEDGED